MEEADFQPHLNAAGGLACRLPWITIMHCHGTGEMATITIAMNYAIWPQSVVVMVLAAGNWKPWGAFWPPQSACGLKYTDLAYDQTKHNGRKVYKVEILK